MRNRHSNKIYIDIFRCMIFLSLSFHLLFKVMFDSMIWRMCALNIQSNLWPVTCRVLWKTPRKNYTVFFYISLVVFVCVCLVFFAGSSVSISIHKSNYIFHLSKINFSTFESMSEQIYQPFLMICAHFHVNQFFTFNSK